MRTSRLMQVALFSAVAVASTLASARDASAQESDDSPAMSANRGLRIGIGPILLTPIRDNGPYGGGLDLDGRYGIKAGPTVIAPGGRLSGYLVSSRFVGMAMPTVRFTVPVGPLAPFVVGGIGGGWISNTAENGLALMGGGGLMIHIGRVVAIGVEATYQTIEGTEFQSVAIGPAISFGG